MATKTKIRPGAISVSDTENAILVEYEQEKLQLLEDGSIGASIGRTSGSKRIKVKDVSASTDLDALANDLMEKCKLIKPSALPTVVAALAKLRDRQTAAPPGNEARSAHADKDAANARDSIKAEREQVGAADGDGGGAAAARERDGKESRDKRKSRREKMSSALLGAHDSSPHCYGLAAPNAQPSLRFCITRTRGLTECD